MRKRKQRCAVTKKFGFSVRERAVISDLLVKWRDGYVYDGTPAHTEALNDLVDNIERVVGVDW